ncbi:hypothetical protein A200_06127 [Parascardovia denticolens IPLA 20019]|nr:hypothetical protein A200_06127 [Parascardovia denticolens IPLA 20019]
MISEIICPFLRSLPARGAWIEIKNDQIEGVDEDGRSPQGERGLKYRMIATGEPAIMSLPARGAWIEIVSGSKPGRRGSVAPRKGSVD